jgi:hypothetical protein
MPLRIATASSICFIPMAFSSRPGMAKVRVTAPAVNTSSSYASVVTVPSGIVTSTDRSACDTLVTQPPTTRVRRRCRRSETAACRASTPPAATSGRNG